MVFNSFSFWVLFPLIFILYWLIPTRLKTAKKVYMVAVSYLFYMLWEPAWALILLGVTLVTYFGALWLPAADGRRRTAMGAVLTVLGLSVLLVFKYYNFVNDSVSGLLTLMDIDFRLPGLNWMIPIGISFFSFQAVGYFLDVYYRRIAAERSLLDYTLFVCFFPQITSGPISKASELLPQLADPRPFDYSRAVSGLRWILWGMFLKTVVADQLGLTVDAIYKDYQYYNGATLALACVYFTIQIYADFAGYSYMAMGIARTLGIDVINNFRQPYFSESISDFWRRWHISLSRWLKDYVYIPLGGNRKGKVRSYLNIMVTFAVSGLWHGASWAFLAWGMLNGVYQVAGDMLKPARQKIIRTLGLHEDSLAHRMLRMLITYLLICISWVLFRSNGLRASVDIFRSIAQGGNLHVLFDGSLYTLGLTQKDFAVLLISIVLLLAADIFKYRGVALRDTILRQDVWARCLVVALCTVLILLFGMWGASHTAASFLYFQF